MSTKVRLPRGTNTPGDYQPLPEGRYDIEITKIEQKQSRNGNPQVMVSGRVVTAGPYSGHKVTDFFVLTEKAAWRFGNLCEAVMCSGDPTGMYDEKGIELLDYNIDELVGRVYVADVTIEAYEKDGKRMESNRFGKIYECSPLDPFYAHVVEAQKESATRGEVEPAAQPTQPAPEVAQPAPVVGRRGPRLGGAPR